MYGIVTNSVGSVVYVICLLHAPVINGGKQFDMDFSWDYSRNFSSNTSLAKFYMAPHKYTAVILGYFVQIVSLQAEDWLYKVPSQEENQSPPGTTGL